MTRIGSSVAAVAMSVVLSACVSPYQAYPGEPKRPEEEAVIKVNPHQNQLEIEKVDSLLIDGKYNEIHLLPGTHTIDVMGQNDTGIFGVHIVSPDRETISVTVAAGRRYMLTAVRDPLRSGVMLAWVADVDTNKVVGGRRPSD